MIVEDIRPRGFCKGVHFAIEKVKEVLKSDAYPKPVYVLGFIVHNKYVVDELSELGAITLDDKNKSRLELVDEIDSGTIVISAHGTPIDVIDKIKNKNITLVDATCQDVYTTHDLIKAYLKNSYNVIYIGKKNHPETNASLSLGDHVYLLENPEDVEDLKIKEPIFVTNQTTFSIKDIFNIHQALKKKYNDIIITEEICNATRIRQNAIIKANEDADLCYIVGDPRSNNSKNLAKISENFTQTKTFLIQSLKDINVSDLKGVKKVTVSSGASTPEYLTKEVVSFLKSYASDN
ncbi:MAG: 4-hydroxy-3-methylbut-2-enyl diphosphate reductase [Candidatus Izemoplasmatales bacterium]|uniref:4-hydroxy-3-methylbut-2-enyl diphosphate reductase n=1 Tax=Hujiaoplasma nucleasis TaxID=2725268 RepID=A0A7L6N2F3_9MOLU|nr:4-hydroxy-3-methylbut-2-enyl diphosphate reductase [Hujiaoplasma nucleasis]QLY39731.1 4-hydroxy-3-methylbut-2-enyl diphosphate reductase [Hujiaoplasma nucleasis]